MASAPTAAPPVWRNRIIGYGEMPPDQFLANPKNWRLHPEFQQEALLGVLEEVGIVQNVIVNQRTAFLVDGHLRVTLALRTGQQTLPVTYVDLTDAEEDLILATLDPVAALAVAHHDLLQDLLARAQAAALGTQQMLDDLAAQYHIAMNAADAPEESANAATERGANMLELDLANQMQAKWGTGPGQIWEIPSARARGSHWVACGDSRDPASLNRLMQGAAADLLLTSPPYGVGMEYEEETPDYASTVALLTAVLALAADLVAPDRFAFLNFGERFTFPEPMGAVYVRIFQAAGWRWYDSRIYQRGAPGQGPLKVWNTMQPRAMSTLEALYTMQKGRKAYPVHDLALSKEPLWQADQTSSQTGHHAVMHVAIAERALRVYTDAGERVLDPFGGILTTLIAAERVGRLAHCQEIDPGYVALGLERAAAAGLTPVLRTPDRTAPPTPQQRKARKQAP